MIEIRLTMTQTCIATFYKFTPLKRLKALRAELLDFVNQRASGAPS